MTAQWKPGDVALVQNGYGVWNRAICQVRPNGGVWVLGGVYGHLPLDAPARSLAVIDPENDHDAIDFLADRLEDIPRVIREALRAFANPTPPRPDEPLGLGAVVEDAEGEKWVRNNPRGRAQWSRVNAAADGRPREYRMWRQVNAVRVLSEGVVTP